MECSRYFTIFCVRNDEQSDQKLQIIWSTVYDVRGIRFCLE